MLEGQLSRFVEAFCIAAGPSPNHNCNKDQKGCHRHDGSECVDFHDFKLLKRLFPVNSEYLQVRNHRLHFCFSLDVGNSRSDLFVGVGGSHSPQALQMGFD